MEGDGKVTLAEMVVDRAARMTQLTRSRTYLKGLVTKRINLLMALINASGSRTKVQHYRTALLEAHEEQKAIGSEMEKLCPNEDMVWVSEEKERTLEVLGDVEEYLESRRDEASSRSSQVSTWLRKVKQQTTPPDEEAMYDDVASSRGEYAEMFPYRRPDETMLDGVEVRSNYAALNKLKDGKVNTQVGQDDLHVTSKMNQP